MEWFWEMLDWTITPIAISIGVFFWIVIIWGDK